MTLRPQRINMRRCGFAALQCGEALPHRQHDLLISEAVPPFRHRRRRSLHSKSRFIGKAKPYRTGGRLSRIQHLIVLLVLVSLASCSAANKQVGVPTEVQATINTVTDDIAAERDEKIFQEAADEWRQASTLEQTKEFFKTLRTKLGRVKNRSFHSARGEQNAGGAKPGPSFVVQYQTAFERAEGMETFTVVERDGHWMLARYFVNSEALK